MHKIINCDWLHYLIDNIVQHYELHKELMIVIEPCTHLQNRYSKSKLWTFAAWLYVQLPVLFESLTHYSLSYWRLQEQRFIKWINNASKFLMMINTIILWSRVICDYYAALNLSFASHWITWTYYTWTYYTADVTTPKTQTVISLF